MEKYPLREKTRSADSRAATTSLSRIINMSGLIRFPAIVSVAASLSIHCSGYCSDSLDIQLRWEYQTIFFQSQPLSIEYDKMERPYFYVAAYVGGLMVFDASPAQPTPIKTLPLSEFASLHVMDVFQQGNYLYAALGDHFKIGGGPEAGLAIVDISNPADPSVKDVWQTTAGVGTGGGIVIVEGDYAYLGAMTQGLIILDVSDKSNIRFVSQIVPSINFPTPIPPASNINARGMMLKDDVLYLCYDAGGLRIINVSDKSNPRETGRYINAAVKDARMFYNNIAVNGNLAYIAIDYCGLEIVDISDTTDIFQVGWWKPWKCNTLDDWLGGDGHANQIVSLDELGLVFLSTGDSELNVVNVSNPLQPRQVGSFGAPNDDRGTWGMELHQQQIFLSYIVAFIPFASNVAGIKLLDWGFSVDVDEKRDGSRLPLAPSLSQNYPNPFNPETTIQFDVHQRESVLLEVFDIQGRKVATLANQGYPRGSYSLKWNGRDEAGKAVSSGVYLYRIHAGKFVQTRKMILAR
jgi:hypothetical protein